MNVQGDQAPAKLQKWWKNRELTHKDHRRTIHELTDTVGFNYGVCQEILTENLNMRRTAAKIVPRLLTNYQKQRCINMCLELWEKANEDQTFTTISRTITGDKGWIYGYDPETKQQSSQWKSPQSPKAKKGAAGPEFNKEHAHCIFLMWRGLFIVNLFLLILWSTLTFTVTFWDAWEKMCEEKGRNFGATTTGSITTRRPPTYP
jgi:hypothetical protein